MPDNCALYLPLSILPSREQLAELDPAATVDVNAESEVATVRWPDAGRELRITKMPAPGVGEHLTGFVNHVRRRGGSEALAMRVLHTTSVFGVVAEPGFGDDGRALQFIGEFTSAGDGLCFLNGEVFDGRGRPLLLAEGGGLAPPDAPRVAARALALLALATRGLLEQDAGSPSEGEAERHRRALLERLGSLGGARGECEPEELEFLSAPIGAVGAQNVAGAVGRAEGAQVLLWALGARALPALDQQEHPFRVARDSGLGDGKLPLALASPSLRPAAEVDALRRRLTAIHWRLREQQLRPKEVDFQAFAAGNWFGGCDLTGVALAGKDLAVRGKPLSEVSDEDYERVRSIAAERHQAANWLIGVHPVYSRVGTPT
jgi:hypothetical protein